MGVLRLTGLDRVSALHTSVADALGGDVCQADDHSRFTQRDGRSTPEPA